MYDHSLYQLLADIVLVLHVTVVAFVIGGLIMVVLGNRLGWRWVNTRSFRLVHLAAVLLVATQAWLGALCPLTTLEMWLREQAHVSTYRGSFIEHWLQQLLYYEAPPWIFLLAYSLFGLMVVAAWWYFPPDSQARAKKKDENAN